MDATRRDQNGARPAGATPEGLEERLSRLEQKLDRLVEETSRRRELVDEMRPITRDVVQVATERLASLESRGYFEIGRELLGVVDRVVDGFSAEDVRQLGDNVVTILQTVRRLTQPQVMTIAGEVSEALNRAGDVEPVTMLGALRRSRDQDVQRGLAVLLEILRQVGRGVRRLEGGRDTDRAARLAARTAPRRARSALPPPTPAPAPRTQTPAPAPAPAKSADALEIPGYALTSDGYLADPDAWTEDFARSMAAALGVPEMTDDHWELVKAARQDFLEHGASPNIRRLTMVSRFGTRDIYRLFPKAPGKAIARIAGIPKPAGCI